MPRFIRLGLLFLVSFDKFEFSFMDSYQAKIMDLKVNLNSICSATFVD